MAVTHEATAGMGGIRAAGDLVFRMEMTGMKLPAAKAFVAEKLHVAEEDLADCAVMKDVREELNIGTTQPRPNGGIGMETKFRIADILGIPINGVEFFKKQAGL